MVIKTNINMSGDSLVAYKVSFIFTHVIKFIISSSARNKKVLLIAVIWIIIFWATPNHSWALESLLAELQFWHSQCAGSDASRSPDPSQWCSGATGTKPGNAQGPMKCHGSHSALAHSKHGVISSAPLCKLSHVR